MRMLIAGCGYVGTALGLQLVQSGHDVVATRRDPAALPDVFERRSADLTDRADVDSLPDVDAVAITVSADGRSVEAYRSAYVDTIAALLASYRHRDLAPSRWVFTSSTAVYGDGGDDWITEDVPTAPESETGAVLVEAEQLLTRLTEDGVISGVAARLGGIYGPGRTRLLNQVANGQATCPPTPTYTNRIHRDDAAAVIAALLVAETVPSVVNVVDDDPAERCEVLTWLAEQLGVASPPTGESTRTRSNKRISNARLRDLGIELRHPTFRSGYGKMIAQRSAERQQPQSTL